jgi:hypothetical protein
MRGHRCTGHIQSHNCTVQTGTTTITVHTGVHRTCKHSETHSITVRFLPPYQIHRYTYEYTCNHTQTHGHTHISLNPMLAQGLCLSGKVWKYIWLSDLQGWVLEGRDLGCCWIPYNVQDGSTAKSNPVPNVRNAKVGNPDLQMCTHTHTHTHKHTHTHTGTANI